MRCGTSGLSSSAAMRDNFSVGANLMQLLLAIQEGEWDDVDLAVRAFQRMTRPSSSARGRWWSRPLASAWAAARKSPCTPRGARRMRSSTWGWWKPALALCPAAAAAKEMCCAAMAAARPFRASAMWRRVGESTELSTPSKRNFETIAMAKVSTSAAEARRLGCLTPADRITMNRERLLLDAKERRCELGRCAATLPPVPRTDIPAAGRERAGHAQAGRPHDAAGRLHQRPRRESGQPGGARAVRRCQSRRARR